MRTRPRRIVGNLAHKSGPAKTEAVFDRLRAFRRIENELYISVDHRIDNMRISFEDLIDRSNGDPLLFEEPRRAPRSNDLKAHLSQILHRL